MVIKGGDKPLVADAHMAWLIQRARNQSSSTAGGDILTASGSDDFLLAPDDGQEEPVVVDRAEITGVEPAVGEGFLGRLTHLPVAAEHPPPAGQQFVVGPEPHTAPAQQLSNRADARAPIWLAVVSRAGLGTRP